MKENSNSQTSPSLQTVHSFINSTVWFDLGNMRTSIEKEKEALHASYTTGVVIYIDRTRNVFIDTQTTQQSNTYDITSYDDSTILNLIR